MTAEPPRLNRAVRVGLSILVIGHLVAIIAPPLAFQAQGSMGSSPSVGSMLTPVQAYGQMLYVDRGYAFFAPDPGPSHLIQAAITDGSGHRTETMIPNLDDQWPRLRYHRHFMLAEFLTEIHQPPGPPQEWIEADPIGARYWLQLRARYEYVRQSVVEHLKHENPGHQVAIRRIEHLIPSFQEMPMELTDQRLYTVLLDQPLVGESVMELPSGPPETIPAPSENVPDSDVPDSDVTDSDVTESDVTESDVTESAESAPAKKDSTDPPEQAVSTPREPAEDETPADQSESSTADPGTDDASDADDPSDAETTESTVSAEASP